MKRQPLRVLIVEDAANAELLLGEIQRGAYEVTYDQVQTARDLVSSLQGAAWDLVIAGDRSPGFTGLDALGVVKATTPDLPFILISGNIGEEAVASAIQAGASDVLLEGRLARLLSAIARVRKDAIERAQQRVAFETLGKSEAQYRSLVERAVVGICQAAPDGRFLTVNPALVAMLGYPSAEALRAVSLVDLFVDDSARVALLQRIKAHVPFLGDEAAWRPKSGAPIRVRLSGSFFESASPALPDIELIVEDITDWQRRQDRLWQAQRTDAIGQLAGELAHDFTDPLSAILGYAELLTAQLGIETPGGKDARELVIAAERAAVLARQLLAVSRKEPIAVAALDLAAVIRAAELALPRMVGTSVQIKTILAADTGLVLADPLQVEQILVNLALRARNAMPNGGVLTIESRASVREAEFRAAEIGGRTPSDFVLLRITDTGGGAASKTIARAAEAFSPAAERGKATGLDVAAVSGIVTRLGGAIYVESDPARGTSFQIYLRKAERTARVARVAPPPAGAPGQETILLVEDQEHIRSFIRTALTRHQYTVLEAPNAEHALELMASLKQPVHLLLTDVVLGGMDGRQLAARVSAEHPYVRTLLMSGYFDRLEPPAGARLAPATALLEKPFTVQLLIQRVREALSAPVAVAR